MNDEKIRKTTGMKADSIEGLSSNFEKLGIQLRREICKEIISRGGPWVSLGFTFQDKKDACDDFGSSKVMLASFKNTGGVYNRYSYFIIKTKEEAQKVCDILKQTFNL